MDRNLAIDSLPRTINSGLWNTGHVQGIALDRERAHIYFSFTTALVKTDLQGNVIGYVSGITGHLGCIDFNEEDGRVYGSIEYKHDVIGRGIMKRTGMPIAEENAFYVGIFDVDRIDRCGMDAEQDEVMLAAYLPDVVHDFEGKTASGQAHLYGCSGMDGTAFGPAFGQPGTSPYMLTVAYGIYGDLERTDNDYQVLLQYDWRQLAAAARPLSQREPHHSGVRAAAKYFLFTGNTTFGIQNLAYDEWTGDWFAAVYRGKKGHFPNYPMFVIDGRAEPEERELRGVEPAEKGRVLSLKEAGIRHEPSGVYGWEFPWGQTGIYSLGEGYFYVSHNSSVPVNGGAYKLETSTVQLYQWTGQAPLGFRLAE